jgi:hypothetical protein
MPEPQMLSRPARPLRVRALRIWNRIKNNKGLTLYFARLLGRWLPDRIYMQLGHLLFFGFWPNFERPRALSENIMAYVLRCRDPLLKVAADKARTRQYVAERIGEQYLVPLYGLWERADDIPLATLPRPCVLKPTAASGLVTLLRPDVDANLDDLRETLHDWLQRDYSRYHREWSYQGIQQRIMAEQMLVGPDGEPPPDYKLWVIGKKVRMITVDRNRFTQRTRNIYRANWEQVDARQYPCANHPTDPRPAQLDHLIDVAEYLAAPFEFMRVDCYLAGDDSLYVGEFTSSPGAGYERFEPDAVAYEMGGYWPRVASPRIREWAI